MLHTFLLPSRLRYIEAQAARGGEQDPEGKPTAGGWGRSKGPAAFSGGVGRPTDCPAVPALPATWARSGHVSPPLILFPLISCPEERKRTRRIELIDKRAFIASNWAGHLSKMDQAKIGRFGLTG